MQKNKISFSTAVFLVMGSMIGSGVFLVSADVAQKLGNPLLLLLVWVATGALTVIAAMSYTELAAMYPKSGGQYVYLKEAYNPLMAFLYGWSLFTVVQCGTIAAVAMAFAKFTAVLLPELTTELFALKFGSPMLHLVIDIHVRLLHLLAIATIVLLTFINTRGIKGGGLLQSYLTVLKALTLLFLIVICIALFRNPVAVELNFSNFFSVGNNWTATALLSAFGLAMVGPLFSSDAWNNVTFIAGEVENPKKNVARALLFGAAGVCLLYLLINIGYLCVLPLQEIATAKDGRVATAAMTQIFGNYGAYIMAALIMVSTFGANNGIILSGARVYQTMANDGLFFKKMGTFNKSHAPAFSLWVQCIWASLLCLSGTYSDLLDYVMFVVILFYVLTIIGLFILRKTKPTVDRPNKAPGYPILPAIYVICMGGFIVNLLIQKPEYTVPGLCIVLSGIPIYFIWRAVHAKTEK